MIKNIDVRAFFVLIIYPILLFWTATEYYSAYSIGLFEVLLFIAGYYGANIAVGVGLHRLWSHNAFKTNKVIEFLLMLVSSGTLQGPVLSWASNHYKHHTYTDKDGDPHSPLKYKNRFVGFLWAHIGWMIIGGSYNNIDRVTLVKLGKSKMLKWQLKYYWQIAVFMNTIVPSLIGFIIGGTLMSAYAGFLFIGIGRALQQHATFCVNSVCHYLGTREYYKGTAGDIWWLALFLLGENWHNYHHAFPSDYRNGVKWYHFDVHKWIIYSMSKVGLAHSLDVTPDIRIKARINETRDYALTKRKEELALLQDKVDNLISRLCLKFTELEQSSQIIRKKFKDSFLEMQESLKKLTDQLHSSVQLTERSSDKLLRLARKKTKDLELSLHRLYRDFDKKYVGN